MASGSIMVPAQLPPSMAIAHPLLHTPILTVTLNPAIDLTLEAGVGGRRDFLTAGAARRSAGGKGVNVARVLSALGVGATAALALGAPDDAVYLSLLEGAPFRVAALAAPGPTRTNVSIIRPGARPLKINQPGPRWRRRDWEAVRARLQALMAGREWVAISGSLPGGVPDGAYGWLAREARRAGARVMIDAEGPALARAISARPALVRINREELAATFGDPCRSRRATAAAVRDLASRTRGTVIVSDGAREIIAAAEKEILIARPPKIEMQSPMGAGDSMAAGVLAALARGEDLARALRRGVAAGAAAAALPDGHFPNRTSIARLAREIAINPAP